MWGRCWPLWPTSPKNPFHGPQDRTSLHPATGGPVAARRGHVLVVEDNHVNQMVAVGMLEHLGHTTEVAGNGLEALVALDRTPFAVILMDCQMPEMDGYEATRAIREREDGERRTPVIAMTASATEGERERCLSAGMDDFLTKPVSPAALRDVLARWCLVPDRSPAALSDPRIEGPTTETPVLDGDRVEELRQLGPNGPALLRRLAAQFRENAPPQLALMRAALSSGSPDHLMDAAHGLKGSALNLGVQRAASICGELEQFAASRDLAAVPATLDRLASELERASDALEALAGSDSTP